MNDKLSSRNQTSQGHIAGEGAFLKSLCEFWKPHQRTDLENRYNLGVMLNIKLGSLAGSQCSVLFNQNALFFDFNQCGLFVGNAGCGQVITEIVKIAGQLLLLGVGSAGE